MNHRIRVLTSIFFAAAAGTGWRGKIICAAVAKSHTAARNDWLADQLAMGHRSYVSSLVNRIRRDEMSRSL